MSSLPASIKRIGLKATEKSWRHYFPHYKSMGAFWCHQSFDPICLKTLCSFSPPPVMLHIKSDQDWPTGFRDIQVWKCGGRRMGDGPLVYYKLTLWAFNSGELKTELELTRVWGCSIFWPPAPPHSMHPGVSSYGMKANPIWKMNWLMITFH